MNVSNAKIVRINLCTAREGVISYIFIKDQFLDEKHEILKELLTRLNELSTKFVFWMISTVFAQKH